jgi:hypothetical protein
MAKSSSSNQVRGGEEKVVIQIGAGMTGRRGGRLGAYQGERMHECTSFGN